MDYEKIGKFIASERKAKNLTQTELADKIFVSEKTISKWERGKGIPDTNSLPELCKVFGVSINELLSGERLSAEKYVDKAEERLLELKKAKVEKDKMLLNFEIVVGCVCVAILLGAVMLASFLELEEWLRVVIILVGLVPFLVLLPYLIAIEQKAGYYECAKCGHKYVPKFMSVFMAMHAGRTRYMKCPHCGEKSWQKKVIE